MAAIHDVQSVVVPVVLAVQKDPADQKVLALVGHKSPLRGVSEVHPLDHHIFAFTEVNEFRPFSDPVVFCRVLKESKVDLIQEVEGAVETSAINDTLSFDRDVFLALC